MDNEVNHGETSTVRTHDRGEITGKPAGSAQDDEATSERMLEEQETGSQVPQKK